jgi:hypothetical protein
MLGDRPDVAQGLHRFVDSSKSLRWIQPVVAPVVAVGYKVSIKLGAIHNATVGFHQSQSHRSFKND